MAEEYAAAFSGEHEKKPKDQEVLHRFRQEIGDRRPVWDLGCGSGQTAKHLKNLDVEISGLDLSERILEQAKMMASTLLSRQRAPVRSRRSLIR